MLVNSFNLIRMVCILTSTLDAGCVDNAVIARQNSVEVTIVVEVVPIRAGHIDISAMGHIGTFGWIIQVGVVDIWNHTGGFIEERQMCNGYKHN